MSRIISLGFGKGLARRGEFGKMELCGARRRALTWPTYMQANNTKNAPRLPDISLNVSAKTQWSSRIVSGGGVFVVLTVGKGTFNILLKRAVFEVLTGDLEAKTASSYACRLQGCQG
jgi:hypothetical protein